MTWEGAASDFQVTKDGSIDETIIEPGLVEYWCSEMWKYDQDSSPNAGRREISVDQSVKLIDLNAIQSKTLVICGSEDPLLNFDLVNDCLSHLPDGSELEVIEGAAHAAFVEKPYYREFQNTVIDFLAK